MAIKKKRQIRTGIHLNTTCPPQATKMQIEDDGIGKPQYTKRVRERNVAAYLGNVGVE